MKESYSMEIFMEQENLHLQLEAALRQRMASVFAEVKRRLVIKNNFKLKYFNFN